VFFLFWRAPKTPALLDERRPAPCPLRPQFSVVRRVRACPPRRDPALTLTAGLPTKTSKLHAMGNNSLCSPRSSSAQVDALPPLDCPQLPPSSPNYFPENPFFSANFGRCKKYSTFGDNVKTRRNQLRNASPWQPGRNSRNLSVFEPSTCRRRITCAVPHEALETMPPEIMPRLTPGHRIHRPPDQSAGRW